MDLFGDLFSPYNIAMFIFFLLISSFGVVSGAIALMIKKSKAKSGGAAWSQVAERVGLRFIPGETQSEMGRIEGNCRGLNVSVKSLVEPGRTRALPKFRTVVHIPMFWQHYSEMWRTGLKVTTDHGQPRSQDLEVGEPEFDRHFVVQSGKPEQVRLFVNPAMQRALLDLQWHVRRQGTIEFTDTSLEITFNGVERRVEFLSDTIAKAVSVADLFQRTRPRIS